jgi:hypothetical protein
MSNQQNKVEFPNGMTREEFIDAVLDTMIDNSSSGDLYWKYKEELDELTDEDLEIEYGFDPTIDDREEFIDNQIDELIDNASGSDMYYQFKQDYGMDEMSDEELIENFASLIDEDDEDEEEDDEE